jgi:hypothetical protein
MKPTSLISDSVGEKTITMRKLIKMLQAPFGFNSMAFGSVGRGGRNEYDAGLFNIEYRVHKNVMMVYEENCDGSSNDLGNSLKKLFSQPIYSLVSTK